MHLNCLTANWDAAPRTGGCSIVLCVPDTSNRKNKDKTLKTLMESTLKCCAGLSDSREHHISRPPLLFHLRLVHQRVSVGEVKQESHLQLLLAL